MNTQIVTPEQAIKRIFDEHFEILDQMYVGGDLNGTLPMRFCLDGLPEAMTTSGNLYAIWCVTLEGALHMDWGWGWYEIVNSISNDGFLIEQNDLNFIAETFAFLNETFGNTTPDVPADLSCSPLHDLLTEHLLELTWYATKFPEGSFNFSKAEFITEYATLAAPYVDQIIARIQGKPA